MSCFALYRRHYSARNKRPKQKQFVGPGAHIVLQTDRCDAVFVWRYYIDDTEPQQEGVECSLFRNEGPILSSELVRQADAVADCAWPGLRHYTKVSPPDIRSVNPGLCFIAAGWRRCGHTKNGLLILERVRPAAVSCRGGEIGDGTMSARVKYRERLEPLAREISDAVCAIQSMTDNELHELIEACTSASETNCGWDIFAAARLLLPEAIVVSRRRTTNPTGTTER